MEKFLEMKKKIFAFNGLFVYTSVAIFVVVMFFYVTKKYIASPTEMVSEMWIALLPILIMFGFFVRMLERTNN